MNEEAAVRRAADLALVDAAVPWLARVDLEAPVLVRVRQAVRVAVELAGERVAKVRPVNGPEALVRRVSVRRHREQAVQTSQNRKQSLPLVKKRATLVLPDVPMPDPRHLAQSKSN